MDIVSIVVSSVEHFSVSLVNSRLFCEFVFQEVQSGFKRAVEQPANKSEREDVASSQH